MAELQTYSISDAVTLKSYTDPHFKTMQISINLILPLSQETAAEYGILPSLISRASKEYPDYTALSKKLSALYGASLDSAVKNYGEFQVLRLSAGGISNRYALDQEDLFRELSQLLRSIVFTPLKDSDGQFPQDGFQQEKRQILEMKDSEFNDKVAYAHRRCEELLFEGEAAGVDRYGSREQVSALQRETLTNAWERALSQARIEIYVLGDCAPEISLFQEAFSGVGQPRPISSMSFRLPKEVRKVEEVQKIAQSKLAMGFRVDVDDGNPLVFQLLNAVLGGVPSSKFFVNIREKMSLCYYCSSSLYLQKKALFVDSGVETENIQKTQDAVLQQIKELQQGNLTEEELLSAKLALGNAMRSVGDSLGAVENWYLTRSFGNNPTQKPEDAADQLMHYSVADVVEAANRIHLSVIFTLRGSEPERED